MQLLLRVPGHGARQCLGPYTPPVFRGMMLFLLTILLGGPAVARPSHDHSTRLYRASRVGASNTKHASPVKMRQMWHDEIEITDVSESEDEEAGTSVRLLTAPGPERRWSWPTLA